jgi:type II secretory pathway component PulM
MKFLRIVATVVLVAGVILAGLGAYFFLINPDERRAEQYSNEQERLLVEAEIAEGTARKRELMKEYEEGKSVTELAWQHARQTRQTVMLSVGVGITLIVVSILALFIPWKKQTRQEIVPTASD